MSGTKGVGGSGGRGKSPLNGVRTGRVGQVREKPPVNSATGLSGVSGVNSAAEVPLSILRGLDSTEARFEDATAYLKEAGVPAMTLNKAVEVRQRNSANLRSKIVRERKRQLLDDKYKSTIYPNLSSAND